jgi:hypothetical protein
MTTVCMVYLLLLLMQTIVHPVVDNSEFQWMWKEIVEKYKVQGPILAFTWKD